MYKALVLFRDTQDDGYVYQPGDTFPRKGFTPSKERIESMLSSNNKQGKPVIEAVAVVEESAEEPKTDQAPKKRGRNK